LVIGPQVKPGYRSSVRYDHANFLRTVCDALGFASCPAAGAVASPMADFFNTVEVSNPLPNAIVASPVHIQASTSNSGSVSALQIYVDNALKFQTSSNFLDTLLSLGLGPHLVVVQSWDAAGGIHKRSLYVNVKSQAVVVTSPVPNAVVGSSAAISAKGTGQNATTKMQLYVDGVSQYQSSGNTLKTSVSIAAGNH